MRGTGGNWIKGMTLAMAGGLALQAHAGVTYLTQSRVINATNTVDGQVLTKQASDFAAFVDSVTSSATFVKVGGGTGKSGGTSGIDCQLDPNALKLAGTLAASGGAALVGNKQETEVGEADVRVAVTFHLDEPTAYSILGSARPSTRAGDKFKVKFESVGLGTLLFLDESMPAQAIDMSGVLPAGDYSFEYEAELRGDGDPAPSDYSLTIAVPGPGGAGAVVTAGVLGVRRRRR